MQYSLCRNRIYKSLGIKANDFCYVALQCQSPNDIKNIFDKETKIKITK